MVERERWRQPRPLLTLLCAGTLVLTACTSGPVEPGPRSTERPPATSTQTRATAAADAGARSAGPTETRAPRESAPIATPTEHPAAVEPTTVLLLGSDAREPGSFNGRADVIVLAQLSGDGPLSLVSIARDTYVPIPGHGQGKINSALVRGGPTLMQQTVSDLLGGLPIDTVVEVNFAGFGAVVEALDGFSVDNTHADDRFAQGRIELDATTALDFVRERQQLPHGDLDRTERARAALSGMMARLAEISENEPARLLALAPVLENTVRVTGDLGTGQLPTMVELGRAAMDHGEIHSVMVPIHGFATIDGQSVNVLDETRTEELGIGLRSGDLSGYLERYGTSVAPTG